MKALAVVILGSLILTGCASSMYDQAAQSWDAWIGTSKDDRVRDLGIPTRCHAFKGGGEACEWPIRWTSDSGGTMTVQFDSKSIVCQWTYRDPYGMRRSQSQCS